MSSERANKETAPLSHIASIPHDKLHTVRVSIICHPDSNPFGLKAMSQLEGALSPSERSICR